MILDRVDEIDYRSWVLATFRNRQVSGAVKPRKYFCGNFEETKESLEIARISKSLGIPKKNFPLILGPFNFGTP